MKKVSLITSGLLLFTLLFLGLSSCTNNKTKVLGVDELLTQAEGLVGEKITVDGKCSHVCEKSGMKLFLEDSTKNITVRAESNSTLGKFDDNCVDKNVRVTGVLVKDVAEVSDHHATTSADSVVCESEAKQNMYHIAAESYRVIE